MHRRSVRVRAMNIRTAERVAVWAHKKRTASARVAKQGREMSQQAMRTRNVRAAKQCAETRQMKATFL